MKEDNIILSLILTLILVPSIFMFFEANIVITLFYIGISTLLGMLFFVLYDFNKRLKKWLQI